MTHMYFSARAEGRISYGHLGRTDSWLLLKLATQPQRSAVSKCSQKISGNENAENAVTNDDENDDRITVL